MATTNSTKTRELLPIGTQAPDFTLNSTPDQKISLSDFRGRPVVLVFYPADWSPVCGDQVALYNEMHDEFAETNAQVIGISVDGVWCHLAFAKDRNLHFPLLADFEPKGEVSKKYGAYHDDVGESSRSLFVLDAAGVVRWSLLSPDGVNPGAAGILKVLDALSPEQRGSAAAGRAS
ncbi:MAG: redoxin domain-containing protein [Gemmatimonadaceae bacterium]|nr:redoxin domain-containing protein [Gemmatimonadaceae bacterium]